MKKRNVLLAVFAMMFIAGCGGGAKKKAASELDLKVNDAVESFKYLDQISDNLIEARVWEFQNKGQINKFVSFVEKKKVVDPAKLAVLPEVATLADFHTLAKPKILTEDDYSKLMSAMDTYYANQKAYSAKAIELSKYIVQSEYKKDGFKKGKTLVDELNTEIQNYKNQGIDTWNLLQGLQNMSADSMSDSPLSPAYKAVTLDVSSYKMVIDLVINYVDKEGELKGAIDAFNVLLQNSTAHRIVGEEALTKAGKKQLYDKVYVEIHRGLRALKDIIVALQEEGKDPSTIDSKPIEEAFVAIHTAYKNFINS
ncbi:hypothetical protein Bcop_1444 [Bacteroides coprosuis DSM 18011]|uniref:Lipoprotein n=1 Tax=Bacteroides coprosuis DSM 18011 TaxID=679937 RepID=F3ZPQ2_9BACE|nr:hypothetical protein [Bacteroides coprosuis]EGJ71639.1 hypothetical protein Bcop_1444 [Bacteroides coprosuis DSM 18011]